MDPVLLTFLALVLSGAIYYFLYRRVFHQKLKWKMIHSMYLPMAVAMFGIGYAAVFLMQPQPGVYMRDLAAVGILIFFLTPVLIFFILYFVFNLKDKRK